MYSGTLPPPFMNSSPINMCREAKGPEMSRADIWGRSGVGATRPRVGMGAQTSEGGTVHGGSPESNHKTSRIRRPSTWRAALHTVLQTYRGYQCRQQPDAGSWSQAGWGRCSAQGIRAWGSGEGCLLGEGYIQPSMWEFQIWKGRKLE